MSDLIDRQAILKHIEKIRQSALMMDDTRRAGIIMQGMHLCEKAVRNQPSAQPEKRTEERAETHACDLIDREAAVDAICHHLPSVSRTRARTMLHEVASAQPEPRWIPCSERFPEDEKDVLVTRHFLNDEQLKKNAIKEALYVEVASHVDDEWISYSDEYKIKRHLHKVIAWMPLPEPYREGGQDENR